MGNMFSELKDEKEQQFQHFHEVVDRIATDYILTMDFQSLTKMTDPSYCEQVVIVTSDIFKNYFNHLEIDYMDQETEDGSLIGKMGKKDLTFINKNTLESIDIKNDEKKNLKKKRVCIGIAKFYVTIAHIFAAIVKTVNPIYIHQNNEGQKVETELMDKATIPNNVPVKVTKLNICDDRIERLTPLIKKDDDKNVFINPKLCELNLDQSGNPINLSD